MWHRDMVFVWQWLWRRGAQRLRRVFAVRVRALLSVLEQLC
jgi:hypothetical protein